MNPASVLRSATSCVAFLFSGNPSVQNNPSSIEETSSDEDQPPSAKAVSITASVKNSHHAIGNLQSSALVLLIALVFLFGMGCRKKTAIPFDPQFAQYISAFTSGTISASSPIRIRLTDAFAGEVAVGEVVQDKLLEFSPTIEGELRWVDNQTLEYTPKGWMKRGEMYEATLHLSKIVKQLPDDMKRFRFSFQPMKQHMEMKVTGISSYKNDDLRWMKLTGTLNTMDACDNNALSQTITSSQFNNGLAVTWTHDADPHIHTFTIDSISRTEQAGKILLKWDGKSVEAEQAGQLEQEIPALGDFKVFFFNVVQQPEQYIQLQFSDPLDAGQDLDGLVDMPNMTGERFSIEGNELRVYPSYRLSGSHVVNIHPGVKNIMGYKSKGEQVFTLVFEEIKPAVKIPDPERVILPSTDGLAFPFEAVNLSAVDVRVIRVYEDNVPQFLQVNDLNGDNEMRRVGRAVKKTTVQLNSENGKDLSTWNTFYLDLNKIIKAEPGAIYRVEVGFKKAYSLYHCEGHEDPKPDDNMKDMEEADADENDEDEFSYWDYSEDYYGDYYEGDYDWDYEYDQRDNPCDDAYYKSRRPEAKNIFASDLGIIAKKGTDNSMFFAVTDMKSTKPLAGVDIELLNYQQQSLAKMKTDEKGQAKVDKLEGNPFLLVAKKDKQRGYLKLDGDHTLSLSTFDTKGEQTQKGLKGFIYGERGVWRPGDTLFLSFILEDERKTLPAIHPVNFELVNPRGQVVTKMVKSKGENGFYNFTCKTDDDAETGNYTANVRVGGATFSKSLKVETIKPNRLKLALDFGKEKITALDENIKGELSAKWLHGAVAKNLKAMVSATFTETTTKFDKYNDYVFDDPIRDFDAEEQVIFDSYMNAEGKALVSMDFDLKDRAPGMVNANFSVKVFEEGGDFSVDRFSIPYAPYENFVGLKMPKGDKERSMLLTDTDHKIDVVTLDAQGKPVKIDSLSWSLYKVQWRWWWESGGDDLASYVGRESTVPISSGKCSTTSDGKGSFKINIKYPDWGRYLVRIADPEGGHAAGKAIYIDWPGWAGRAQRENPGGASMLTFSLNKDKYTVGDECTVTFPSSGVGRALVSIESGTNVIEAHWVEAKKDQTTFTFKTNVKMTPNAYINIALVQPHNQTANDLPIRLYGVMPIFVENPNSHLDPVIAMADELAPEKSFDVKVSEKSGKAMTYTLAIVDEGLLDLTRFKTPDPWNHFYAREALGVNTYDMYDEVIGAFGAKLEKLLSLGGDGEAGGKAKNRANRFKPVVMFAGPFTIEAGKSKTHKFTMPNYIGSVRVMVVAGKDMAYGNAEKAVLVKKPLMVLASLPRVLGPGEEVKLPVTVFAMDKNIKEVVVKVEPNDFFTIEKSSTQNISFKEPGDDVVNFSMKVNEKIGVGKVKVTVTSGKFSSTYDVEMDVRNPNPYITNVVEGLADAGKTWSGTFNLPGMAGTNTTVLEVSTIPPVDFGRRLKYLLDYPHGCIEQTTSGAFPQLYLADVIEMNDAEKSRASENVKSAINQLAKFQVKSGAMTYWPGSIEESEWGTNYAGHFLLEAEKKGFTLPSGWKTSWTSYQKTAAQNWRPQTSASGNYYWRENDLVQAYRLYTLSLAGSAEMGAMNRLKEFKGMSTAARWRLAAAYAMAGQPEVAKQLVNGLTTTIAPYHSLGYTYGSHWRDEAMIVETLVAMKDRVRAAPVVKELAAHLSSASWCSTQETAYALLAISKFAGGEVGKQIKYAYTLNGKASPEKGTMKPVAKQDLSAKMTGNTIELKNSGSGLLYVRVITTGQPLNGQETPGERDLKMTVKYTDLQGVAVDVTKMEQATDFIAEVTVTHPGIRPRYDEVALTQIFPSGWEIINSRMDVSAVVANADEPEYQDIRDDRVYSYFDLYPNQKQTYRIKLNATYLGKYYLPAVNCEAMYDNTISARTAGKWVEVVPAGGSVAMK